MAGRNDWETMSALVITGVIVLAVIRASGAWHGNGWIEWVVLLLAAFAAGYALTVLWERLKSGRWQWRPPLR